MPAAQTAAIVLAAGLGTRMASDRPKVLHEVASRSLIAHVVASLAALKPRKIALVVGPGMDEVTAAARAAAPRAEIVPCLQRERRGTGHAVAQAKAALRGFTGDVIATFGDVPLVRSATFARALAARRAKGGPAVVVVGMRPADPGAYGRLVAGEGGTLERIVEARDATDEERQIGLCNSGIIAADAETLFELVAELKPDNAQGELYLTDIVAIARKHGLRCGYVEGHADELIGINSRAELAVAEASLQTRMRGAAMAAGATLVDPTTVWFSWDTKIGRDITVFPHVFFGPGVTVSDGVQIFGFCHIAGASIARGATIGPFARLRPGAKIGEGAHIGNFVEIKAARIEAGAKVNHLTYVGDARVGAAANLGAGTITCNYDGFTKEFTDIGARAFIGSNSALVAPVKIGDGAIVAAGSVITAKVPPESLAIARGRQEVKAGWARAFRKKRGKKK
jgi:bifunctional UDP-N-acetylglucosamine pyrophosphorylase / glucosamine-1-phosphate N-acetyltransferase